MADPLKLRLGLAGAFCLVACRSTAQVRDTTYTLQVGTLTRTYLLHTPPTADRRLMPLVVLLHGRLGTGPGEERLARFNPIADRVGALVAYPAGYRRSWADGRGGTPADDAHIDDVGFFSAMVQDIARRWPVDSTRIYVAGMSNGAFMTERLACELGDRIAAIGIVVGTLSDSVAAHCHLPRPVPVMAMNGVDDPLVPYGGGDLSGGRGHSLSVAASVADWVAWDGCSADSTVVTLPDTARDGTQVAIATHPRCREGAEVVEVSIAGGGHTWPGGPQYLPVGLVGRASHNLNGSEALWQFFSRHAIAPSSAGH